MKKNTLTELSNEELLKKRDLMKGVAIGFSIIYLFVLALLLYLLLTEGFKNISLVVFVPIFLSPTILMPLLLYFGMLKKEIKSRQL
jgi:putative effector of murein hydrolase